MLALRNDSARMAHLSYEREQKLHEEIARLGKELEAAARRHDELRAEIAAADERTAHVTRDRDDLSAKLRQAYDTGTDRSGTAVVFTTALSVLTLSALIGHFRGGLP